MKHYLGIDLGGTNIAVGITDETGGITEKYSSKTNAAQPFEGLVRDIAETAKKAVEIAGLKLSDIAAVGLGIPSCINPPTNLLVNANNLNWQNVPLYDELKKYFEVPVFIQNDAACAALGEAICGAASEYENAVMVTLGTGVGSGIIMNKRIFNGCDDMGAEIGHTKLVFDGLPCTCGQKGCFEAYASATALINQARNAARNDPQSIMNELCGGDMSKMNAKIPFDAAKAGDIKIFVDTVRASGGNNSERVLLIATHAQAVTEPALKGLELIDDKYVGVALHAYIPYSFCYHSGESYETFEWDGKENSTVDYVFDLIDKYITSKGVPVMITEYGAEFKLVDGKYNTGEVAKWITYFLGKAKDRNISCVIWDNNERTSNLIPFGLYNRDEYKWHAEDILEAIMKVYEEEK